MSDLNDCDKCTLPDEAMALRDENELLRAVAEAGVCPVCHLRERAVILESSIDGRPEMNFIRRNTPCNDSFHTALAALEAHHHE
jgi:hypothetical protein